MKDVRAPMLPNPRKCQAFVMDQQGNKGCFPVFNHWSGFHSWLIGLSLQSQKKSQCSCRTQHRLTSITERGLACTAEQQLTFTQESCQCFLQTRITQTCITQLALRVKRASTDSVMRSSEMTHNVYFFANSGNVACFLSDVFCSSLPTVSIEAFVDLCIQALKMVI